VQSSQDNRSNMMKNLEKERTGLKIASQHYKNDENVEYARNAYLNARRSHIKSGIGYRTGDKHNSRVNTRGQEFIKFTKTNIQYENKQSIKTTNNASYAYTNASHISHISYHDFCDAPPLSKNGQS
jgi:hypothetical protein